MKGFASKIFQYDNSRSLRLTGTKQHKQTPATLCYKGTAISRSYKKITRMAVHKPQHMEYTREKFGWSNETYKNINWEAFGFVTGRLHINRRIRQSKFNHRWLPIGSRRKIIDNLAPVKCPCCNKPGEETHDHILTCQAASRIDVRTKFLESYGEMLGELKAPNLMRSVILNSIDEWNKDQNYTCPITQEIRRDHALHKAVRAQNEIGYGTNSSADTSRNRSNTTVTTTTATTDQ